MQKVCFFVIASLTCGSNSMVCGVGPLAAPIPLDQHPEPGSPYEVPSEMRSLLKKKKRKLDPIEVFGGEYSFYVPYLG